MNRTNTREFVDEMEGKLVPKKSGINFVTESLYSYFMKGTGYEKGGEIYEDAEQILSLNEMLDLPMYKNSPEDSSLKVSGLSQ